MRSKHEIERQLEHFKTSCTHQGSAENEVWIKALEWVLGDADHRTAYERYLDSIANLAGEYKEAATTRERSAITAVNLALERLR